MASAAKRSRGRCDAKIWTKDKTMQLIELFESYDGLWNASSHQYCRRNSLHKQKQKLLSEIAEKMEIDATEVASKLHNLRCQYNGELRKLKVKKSAAQTGESHVSRWEFFNALKFLSNAGQSCNTFSNLDEKKSSKINRTTGVKQEETSRIANTEDFAELQFVDANLTEEEPYTSDNSHSTNNLSEEVGSPIGEAKLELLRLQKRIIQEEAHRKKVHEEEQHDIKMDILRMELMIKKKQLKAMTS